MSLLRLLYTLPRSMPQIFLPPEALEYLRRSAAASFQEDVKVAKEYAVSASMYHVQDRVERYQKFIDQLVSFTSLLPSFN